MYRQVYEAIRDGIHSGRLAPGTRLPSTRDLAHDLRLSRNTVATAFDQLLAEGYVTSRVGRGTSVVGALGEPAAKWNPAPSARPARSSPPSRLATSLLGMANAIPEAASPHFTFPIGMPAIDLFPDAVWARLAARHARQLRVTGAARMDPAGLPALRDAIATHYAAARGIRCTASQVVIVRGTQQALDLLARTLIDPGDTVVVEDPGFPGARGAFTAAGARVTPVSVDQDGLRVDLLAKLEPRARAVYVTPAHQFPLGAQLSFERRVQLLRWSRAGGGWILEDDYDSEFRFAGQPIAALRSVDPRVIYLGSFSKTLLPALRLGFVIVPDELVAPLLAVRVQVDLSPSLLEQAVLADFIAEGRLGHHRRLLRRVVTARRACLLEHGDRELRGLLALQEEETGLHLVGWLAEGIAADRATAAAEAQGVDVLPLDRFTQRQRLPPALLLGFGAAREPDIRDAVRRLKRALLKARRA